MGPDQHAPYGYMPDASAPGGKRPKKRPGRQPKRTAPAPTEPTAAEPAPRDGGASPVEVPEPAPSAAAEGAEDERIPLERTEDRAPSRERQRQRGRARAKAPSAAALVHVPKPPKESIPFRAGPIAKGMNKFYRRIGKIIKIANKPLGQAFIEITRKEDEDDVTVGEAWEELARVHPAIRGALMKAVTGGAVGGLIFAHLPILVAVLMLEPIATRFPLGQFLLLLLELDDDEEDEDGEEAEGGDFPSFPAGGLGDILAGMSQADMAQALAFAQQMGDQIGTRAAGGVHRGGDGA